MIVAILLAATQPGELRTFKDWTVGCDNGLACQAVALLPEDNPEAVTMTVKRGPEPDAAVRIEINPPEKKAVAALIDGRRFPLAEQIDADQVRTLRPQDRAAFLATMLGAKSAMLVDAAGASLGALTASGASAALLYMDERQRRIGTVTALVRKGSKPAAAVPPPPALPVVRQPSPSAKPARTLPAAQVRRLLGREATVCEYAQDLHVETGRLDARNSLVLASHPCGNGAYNLFSSAWIVDENGRARPAAFDVSGGMGEADDTLVNAAWDARARRLTTFSKGRGLGDCGTGHSYAWDGTRFRLVHEEAMGECRGSVDYITTWRAEVR